MISLGITEEGTLYNIIKHSAIDKNEFWEVITFSNDIQSLINRKLITFVVKETKEFGNGISYTVYRYKATFRGLWIYFRNGNLGKYKK